MRGSMKKKARPGKESELFWKHVLGSCHWVPRAFKNRTLPPGLDLETIKRAAHEGEAAAGRRIQLKFEDRLATSEPLQLVTQVPDQPCGYSQFDVLNPRIHDEELTMLGEELSIDLERVLRRLLKKKKIAFIEVRRGPKKTWERVMAKAEEYRQQQELDPSALAHVQDGNWNWRSRKTSAEKAKMPRRPPWVFRVFDFCRVSVLLGRAQCMLDALDMLRSKFQVVGVKNGFRKGVAVPPSGYRDVKVLVKYPSDEEVEHRKRERQKKLERIARKKKKKKKDEEMGERLPVSAMICEIQILHSDWLQCKKRTSFAYKIRRAENFDELCGDFGKYLVAGDQTMRSPIGGGGLGQKLKRAFRRRTQKQHTTRRRPNMKSTSSGNRSFHPMVRDVSRGKALAVLGAKRDELIDNKQSRTLSKATPSFSETPSAASSYRESADSFLMVPSLSWQQRDGSSDGFDSPSSLSGYMTPRLGPRQRSGTL